MTRTNMVVLITFTGDDSDPERAARELRSFGDRARLLPERYRTRLVPPLKHFLEVVYGFYEEDEPHARDLNTSQWEHFQEIVTACGGEFHDDPRPMEEDHVSFADLFPERLAHKPLSYDSFKKHHERLIRVYAAKCGGDPDLMGSIGIEFGTYVWETVWEGLNGELLSDSEILDQIMEAWQKPEDKEEAEGWEPPDLPLWMALTLALMMLEAERGSLFSPFRHTSDAAKRRAITDEDDW
jgi:hypothetical protein